MSDNNPAVLYEFTFPGGVTHLLTGDNKVLSSSLSNYGPESATFFGQEYRYAAISYGAVRETTQIKKQEITIRLPLTDPTGRLLISTPFGDAIGLTITEAYPLESLDPSTPFTKALWTGTVGGSRVKDEVIEVTVENIFASLQKTGNRARYSKMCRHSLYGRGCNVNLADHWAPITVTIVSRDVVTVPGIEGRELSEFVGGIIEKDGIPYYILSASTPTGTWKFRLDRPFLEGTGSATMAPGCNRSQEVCHARFNNLANFGGFPYIPGRNPYQSLGSVV